MCTGAVTHLSCIVALLLWKPHPDQLAVFFVFSGLWGVADAVWQTQNNGECPVPESPLGGPYLGQPWGHMVGRGPAVPGPRGEVSCHLVMLEQEARGGCGSRCQLGFERFFSPTMQKEGITCGYNFLS